ncbi:hypothetical protein NITMOv2_4238 [Nitrospira moscoviensis]|uniref:Uncharacterized protein n=1 Tax=Nitrospira moscoviensis TaxID=42253 RepID=A0A0K2GJ03_NITMO|nr:hypothetical protein NITMOv2_4238 [Nitrospira moscoviensis]
MSMAVSWRAGTSQSTPIGACVRERLLKPSDSSEWGDSVAKLQLIACIECNDTSPDVLEGSASLSAQAPPSFASDAIR